MVPKKIQAQKTKRKVPSTDSNSSDDDHTYGNKFLHFIDEEAMKAHRERFAN